MPSEEIVSEMKLTMAATAPPTGGGDGGGGAPAATCSSLLRRGDLRRAVLVLLEHERATRTDRARLAVLALADACLASEDDAVGLAHLLRGAFLGEVAVALLREEALIWGSVRLATQSCDGPEGFRATDDIGAILQHETLVTRDTQ